MKVGLIDADMMWNKRYNGRRYGNSKADVYPNLALLKLSAYHKGLGDEVGFYQGIERYDKVYISKVFSATPESREFINADKVVRGGSGYCIKLVDGKEIWQIPDDPNFMTELPYEIEHIMPDYSLYPMIKDTAMGFLSRGCPRGCLFCHVATKEGRNAYKVADLKEWWGGQKNIVLMDPNILACREWKDLLTQLAESKAWVDINQGLDARLITPEKVEYLNKIKIKNVHFAWDDYKQKDKIIKGLKCFAEHYKKKIDRRWAQVFVLTNFDTTQEQDLERIYLLRDMGYAPYVMVYDKNNAKPFYKSLQRWVNMRAIFYTIPTFEEYDKKKAKE